MRTQYKLLLLIAPAALPCVAGDKGLNQAVERAIYRLEPSGNGTYQGVNPAQHMTVEFDAHSIHLRHAQANVGFRLVGYGYGEHLHIPVKALPSATANRIEYRRGELTEWYMNEPSGLEQGFTLERRPGTGLEGEPLVITLSVEGELRPALAGAGAAVLLQSGARTVLRYGDSRSWDARGVAVATRLELREQQVRLVVEDRDAEYPLVVDPSWVQDAELNALDGASGDEFGISVSVSGDTAVVGARSKTIGVNMLQGAAYVFVRSGSTWTQQQELTSPDGAAYDQFGFAVSVDGDTVVVGAQEPIGAGAAYMFVRSGTIWTLQQKLTAYDAALGDQFGWAVSLSGETAVVGAIGRTMDGAAYVFVRSGTTWVLQQELSGCGGWSATVSGDTAVVGDPFKQVGSNMAQGAAYVFVRSRTTWTLQQELVASDAASGDEFGFSVSVSGDTAVIGAYGKNIGSNISQGATYVFTRTGTMWRRQQELVASDGDVVDGFGYSVSVSGDAAAIGAFNKYIGPGGNIGAAYVFARTGITWMLQQELIAPDGVANDQFGAAVSVSGDTVIVGGPLHSVGSAPYQGAAYIFDTLNPISLSPNGGDGFSPQTFRAVYSDPNGASDLQVVYLDFGPSLFAADSCIVAYVPYGNSLYLFKDDNSGAFGPITAGTNDTLYNSQCTLSGSGGTATAVGNNLTAPFAITFAGGFVGTQNVYGLAQNYSGTQSAWQRLGTWTP